MSHSALKMGTSGKDGFSRSSRNPKCSKELIVSQLCPPSSWEMASRAVVRRGPFSVPERQSAGESP